MKPSPQRDTEIMRLKSMGMSFRKIAKRLDISASRVQQIHAVLKTRQKVKRI